MLVLGPVDSYGFFVFNSLNKAEDSVELVRLGVLFNLLLIEVKNPRLVAHY